MKAKKYFCMYLLFAFFAGMQINFSQRIIVGDQMPNFELLNQFSTSISSDSLRVKKGVVLFFYSNKESFKKNKSAYEFKNKSKLFKDLDVKIVGVVADAIPNIREFTVRERIKYDIISDNRGMLHDMFGVSQKKLGSGSRVYTFVFKEGVVVKVMNTKDAAESQVYDALGVFIK